MRRTNSLFIIGISIYKNEYWRGGHDKPPNVGSSHPNLVLMLSHHILKRFGHNRLVSTVYTGHIRPKHSVIVKKGSKPRPDSVHNICDLLFVSAIYQSLFIDIILVFFCVSQFGINPLKIGIDMVIIELLGQYISHFR